MNHTKTHADPVGFFDQVTGGPRSPFSTGVRGNIVIGLDGIARNRCKAFAFPDSTGRTVRCEKPEGHDEVHYAYVEANRTVSWPVEVEDDPRCAATLPSGLRCRLSRGHGGEHYGQDAPNLRYAFWSDPSDVTMVTEEQIANGETTRRSPVDPPRDRGTRDVDV